MHLPILYPVDKLANTRHVTVILRLVLNQRNQVKRGEILNTRGKSLGQFVGWAGFMHVLRVWLSNQPVDPPGDQPAV